MPLLPSKSTIASIGNAIATQEGFGKTVNGVPTKPTRTYNPGDLGNTDDGSTRAYDSPEAGYNALYGQVTSMFDGTSQHYNPNMTFAEVGHIYAKDPNWAAGVASQLGVPTTTKLSDIASGAVQVRTVPQPQPGEIGSTSTTPPKDIPNTNVDDSAAVDAVPVYGATISPGLVASVMDAVDPSVIIDSGLQQTAWYNDDSILQVDKATSAVNYPVQFAIFMQKDGDILPISLKLNASMRTFQPSMKHITTRRPSRTGMVVSLWGMAMDMISGSASTGLFINQLGVTDFLSLSTASDEIKSAVNQAFLKQGQDIADIEESLVDRPGYLRIASKDAFVEFLAMFKNNGTVWFRNQNYTGVTTGQQQQVGTDAWSPITGSSTFQNASRRNDVMVRGKVVMYYRNAQYSGYFKSLSWQMDAKNPFRWNFNFVFQVENTSKSVWVPA